MAAGLRILEQGLLEAEAWRKVGQEEGEAVLGVEKGTMGRIAGWEGVGGTRTRSDGWSGE